MIFKPSENVFIACVSSDVTESLLYLHIICVKLYYIVLCYEMIMKIIMNTVPVAENYVHTGNR